MPTINSNDKIYNSPMIGNGEIVTTIGPTGYHNGFCSDEEFVNRTVFWAGRRMSDARSMDIHIPRVPPEELIGPTRPLLRLGRFIRSLQIDGENIIDNDWEQSIDYERARIVSNLTHNQVFEQTTSCVLLNANIMVFHTKLENQGQKPVEIEFQMEYEFGDSMGKQPNDMRLNIRRPHPDDLSFGNVEGIRSLETEFNTRPPHLLENLLVQYEIENHIGEVRIGRFPNGKIQQTNLGGVFSHSLILEASQSTDFWFWVVFSDRYKLTHFPIEFDQIQNLLVQHDKKWQEFWNKSRILLNQPDLELIIKSSLYTLRCYANPFTVPVGNLSTHWEGRILHDDFYAFIGLSSSNHLDIAEQILQNRINTIPVALRRSNGHGLYFGWEVTEDGEESAPYGHWTDEQFRHGQISEMAWRYYLYTGKENDLRRIYPLLKGCAEWLLFDSVEFESAECVKTRLVTDILEAVFPVKNSIYLCCATIKALRNAARGAEILNIDGEERQEWIKIASLLQKTLPVDLKNHRYRYSDNAEAPLAYAHSAMVFPFAFDINGELADSTVSQAYEIFHNRLEETGMINESQEDAVFSDNWMWEVSGLASALFYQGKAEQGLEALKRIPHIVGPFSAPCEHFRLKGGPYLPWFGTGSGIFIAAVNSMFVQVLDEGGTILLPALPGSIKDAEFNGLLASNMVEVSGKVKTGKLNHLMVMSKTNQNWKFRIPTKVIDIKKLVSDQIISISEKDNYLIVECRLKESSNLILSL